VKNRCRKRFFSEKFEPISGCCWKE